MPTINGTKTSARIIFDVDKPLTESDCSEILFNAGKASHVRRKASKVAIEQIRIDSLKN